MGIATGLLVGGLIAKGVTDMVGAKKASSAAKDAAAMQTAAADKASKINDEIYGPYVRQANSARGTLGRLTTPGPGARYAAADPGAPPPAPAPRPMGGGRPRPQGAPNMGAAQPRGGPFGSMVQARGGGNPQMQAPGGGGPQAPNGMALVEAPDGSGVRPVPLDQVDRFVQAGAKRVG